MIDLRTLMQYPMVSQAAPAITRLLPLSVLTLVALGLVLAAAFPGASLAWNVTTAAGDLFASTEVRLFFGATAVLAIAASCRSRDWPSVMIAFPAILLAVFPYDRLSLDTSLARSPLAFERAVDEHRLRIGDQEADATIADPESRKRVLEGPARAYESIGSSFLMAFFGGASAVHENFSDWQQRGKASAMEALDKPPITIADPTEAQVRYGKAIRALGDAELRRETCIDIPRMGMNGNIFPRSRCRNVDLRPYQQAEAAAKAERDAVMAQKETDTRNENQRLEGQRQSIRDAIALTETLDVAVKDIRNWTWSLAISLSALSAVLMASILMAGAQWTILAVATFGLAAILARGYGVAPGLDIPGGHSEAPFMVMSMLTYLAVAATGCLVRRIWLDNREFWSRLAPGRRLGVALLAFLRWIPLGIIIAIGIWGGIFLKSRAIDLAYDASFPPSEVSPVASNDGSSCANPERKIVIPFRAEERNLEIDTDHSVRCHFRAAKAAALAVNSTTSDTVVNMADSAGNLAMESLNRIVPTSLPCSANGRGYPSCVSEAFNYPDCDWWKLKCKFQRIPHRAAERAYLNARADALGRVEKRVELLKSQAEAGSPVLQSGIDAASMSTFSVLEEQVRDRLWQAFRAWDVFDVAAFLVFLIATLKSVIYVLARVFYAQKAQKIVRGDGKSDPITAEQVVISDSQSAQLTKLGRYYVRSGAAPSDVAPIGPFWPRPLSLFVARFPFRLFFNTFTISKPDVGCGFSVQGNGRFVIIELREAQSVSFNVPDLYAWSASLRLKTFWSFRLPNLFRGRITASVATGPGTLVLLSRGRVHLVGAETPGEGIPPTRLLAWSTSSDFLVHSNTDWSSMYLGGVLMKPQGTAVAIFDAERPGVLFPGAIRFVPILLSPV